MAPGGSGAPAARTILLREVAASALWTTAVLGVLGATHAPALHAASPSAAFPRLAAAAATAAAAVGVAPPPAVAVPPFGLFLSALLPLMVAWEGLGLGFGATMNPAIAVAATVAGQVRRELQCGVAGGQRGLRRRRDCWW